MYRIKFLETVTSSNNTGNVTKTYHSPVYDSAKIKKVAKQWKIIGMKAIAEITITQDYQILKGEKIPTKMLTESEVVELFYPSEWIRDNKEGFTFEDQEIKEALLQKYKGVKKVVKSADGVDIIIAGETPQENITAVITTEKTRKELFAEGRQLVKDGKMDKFPNAISTEDLETLINKSK